MAKRIHEGVAHGETILHGDLRTCREEWLLCPYSGAGHNHGRRNTGGSQGNGPGCDRQHRRVSETIEVAHPQGSGERTNRGRAMKRRLPSLKPAEVIRVLE